MNEFDKQGQQGQYHEGYPEQYYPSGEKLTSKKEPSQWIIDLEYVLGKMSDKFANAKWILCIIIGTVCNIAGWYTILLLPQIFTLLAILVGFGVGTFLFLLGIIKLDMDQRWGLKWLMITIATVSNAIVIFTYLSGLGFVFVGILLLLMAAVAAICTLIYIVMEYSS